MFIFIGLLLVSCGTSEGDIQTAIAKTEAVNPTNTVSPTKTTIPTPANTPTPTPKILYSEKFESSTTCFPTFDSESWFAKVENESYIIGIRIEGWGGLIVCEGNPFADFIFEVEFGSCGIVVILYLHQC